MSSGPVRFEDVIGLWEDGQRRLHEADREHRETLERVTDAIVVELRRRLGGQFTQQELADLYLLAGTDWCFAVATEVAPGQPEAWDIATVAGAAFARYVREATDYSRGRRIPEP